jgi:hypothetical protein
MKKQTIILVLYIISASAIACPLLVDLYEEFACNELNDGSYGCSKTVYSPYYAYCHSTDTSSNWECFVEDAPSLIVASVYMGVGSSCSDCYNNCNDYVPQLGFLLIKRQAYNNDTVCGGNYGF